LAEELQLQDKVVVAGPTTLAAILNSLQMGFRTLAIEKRTDEVWKILSEVKTLFARFSRIWRPPTSGSPRRRPRWRGVTQDGDDGSEIA
jgi:hypothetical protein